MDRLTRSQRRRRAGLVSRNTDLARPSSRQSAAEVASMITTKKKRSSHRSRSDHVSELMKQLAPVAMPPAPLPMLCTLVAEPFDNAAWIFESKYDGLRIVGRLDGPALTLFSRNQAAQNFQFPDVVAALEDSLKRPAIVDGEIVCLDQEGRS